MILEQKYVAEESGFQDIIVDILLFNDDLSGLLFSHSGRCRMLSVNKIWKKIHIIKCLFLEMSVQDFTVKKRILISFKLFPICFCLLA